MVMSTRGAGGEPADRATVAGTARRPSTGSHVQLVEVLLLGGTLLFALASYATGDRDQIGFLIQQIVILNVILFVVELRITLRTGLLGKTVLVGACIAYYWLEAVSRAGDTIPFSPQTVLGLQTMDLSVVRTAIVLTAVFEAALFVGYSTRFTLRSPVRAIARMTDRRSAVAVAPFFLAPLVVVADVATGGSVSGTFRTLIESRTSGQNLGLAGGNYIANAAFSLGIFGLAVLGVHAVVTRRRRILTVVVLLACGAPILFSGSRHLFLFVAVAPLIAVLLRTGNRGGGPALSPKARRRILVLGGVILVILQAQLTLRAVGFNQLSAVTVQRLSRRDVTEQFGSLMFAVSYVPKDHGYFHELFEPYFLIQWVPSQVWHDKPTIKTFKYFDDRYTNGIHGSNQTPSVIGQYYMSWGPLGAVIAGLWLGFLTRMADRMTLALRKTQIVATALVGMVYTFIIASFRFYAPYYFAFVVIAAIAAMFMTVQRRETSTAPTTTGGLSTAP